MRKRTGEILRVPEGINPGFDTNPGRVRKANQDRLFSGKLEAAPAVVAQTATRDVVRGGLFEAFLKEPRGIFATFHPLLRM